MYMDRDVDLGQNLDRLICAYIILRYGRWINANQDNIHKKCNSKIVIRKKQNINTYIYKNSFTLTIYRIRMIVKSSNISSNIFIAIPAAFGNAKKYKYINIYITIKSYKSYKNG